MANTSVFAIYNRRDEVERAVAALRSAGFRATDISVLWPENEGTKDLAHEMHTKAPEGAAAGAGTGALIGGALGWLAGIGALAIPGIGPFIAAGPIVAALAGAGAAGAWAASPARSSGMACRRSKPSATRGASERRNPAVRSRRQRRVGEARL